MAKKEYIEREAVMQKFADHVKRSNNSDFVPAPTWNQAVQIVEDFPAADVREVVKATNKSASGFLCSACGFGDFGGFHGYTPNYCPNCGADMREGN